MRVGLFTPDKAFEVVTKSRITDLKPPCLKLIELVVEEIKQTFASSISKVHYRSYGGVRPFKFTYII